MGIISNGITSKNTSINTEGIICIKIIRKDRLWIF